MVSVEARKSALELMYAFSSGSLSFDDLDDQWPSDQTDRAVSSILEVLAKLYGGDFTGSDGLIPTALPQDQRDLLKRCELFLKTNYEYGWPGSPVSRSFLAALQTTLTMGLIHALEDREYEAFIKIGEIGAWPFLTMRDLSAVEANCGRGDQPPSTAKM